MISPEVARQLLDRNVEENRNLRVRHVQYLTAAMKEGRWHPTGDAICLRDGDGALMNGQHRLTAVIKSGCTVEMLIAEDVTPEAFRVMDRGALRSVSDVTGLTNELVSDITLIYGVMQGSAVRAAKIPEEKVIDLSTWWQSAHDLTRIGKGTGTRGLYNAPVRVAFGLRWAISSNARDRSYIRDQWRAMASNDPTAMSRATASLWKKLVMDPTNTGKTASDKVTRLKVLHETFYVMDPARAEVSPKIGGAQVDVSGEVQKWLLSMEDAYLGAPRDTEHPYLFAAWANAPYVRKSRSTVRSQPGQSSLPLENHECA
jgi:hypothetical protein